MDPNCNRVDSIPNMECKRVGYWLSEKKTRELKFLELANYCREYGLDFVKIHLDKPLEPQGPFAAIVHKLSDVVIRGDQGHREDRDACQRFEEYVARHPETTVIDPIPNVRQLLDRYRQYKIIQDCNLGSTVFTPPFVEITSSDVEENLAKLEQHNVKFPIVCKPSVAHGSTLAHQMCLIFGPQGLGDVSPPCVAQEFVCHGAVLYKIFVVGQKYFVIERPSLKNFKAGDQETIFFDSHDISKITSTSWLIKLDEDDLSTPPLQPERERLDQLTGLLQRRLGLDLFGIDVILDSSNGHYAIIDINTFPGYKGIPSLWKELCNLILTRIACNFPFPARIAPPTTLCISCRAVGYPAHVRGLSNDHSPCLCCPVNTSCNNRTKDKGVNENGHSKASNNSTEDSGIDTSDSCDEKKLKSPPVVKNVKRQHSKSASFLVSCLPSNFDKLAPR